jgi:SagB-type dehydrogenase family enzyme
MIAHAEERHANIQLPYVKRTGGLPLRDALSRRASTRMFAGKPLELQTIADLLWAAFGVNRPDDGGRTAPSARNWREIEIYVTLSDGAYRYDPLLNRLDFIVSGDLRSATGVQDFAAEAPLNLVYVADHAKMEGASEAQRDVFAAADASFIAQNVYLFCAAEGLATVVRALIDRPALAKAMRLDRGQHIVLAQSVGYPAMKQ